MVEVNKQSSVVHIALALALGPQHTQHVDAINRGVGCGGKGGERWENVNGVEHEGGVLACETRVTARA